MESIEDDKYVVFKRDEFEEFMKPQAVNMATAQARYEMLSTMALPDAVVIRRQDKFASPALFAYASHIGMVAALIEDEERRNELMVIADYFQRQAELAGEEAWKLPD